MNPVLAAGIYNSGYSIEILLPAVAIATLLLGIFLGALLMWLCVCVHTRRCRNKQEGRLVEQVGCVEVEPMYAVVSPKVASNDTEITNEAYECGTGIQISSNEAYGPGMGVQISANEAYGSLKVEEGMETEASDGCESGEYIQPNEADEGVSNEADEGVSNEAYGYLKIEVDIKASDGCGSGEYIQLCSNEGEGVINEAYGHKEGVDIKASDGCESGEYTQISSNESEAVMDVKNEIEESMAIKANDGCGSGQYTQISSSEADGIMDVQNEAYIQISSDGMMDVWVCASEACGSVRNVEGTDAASGSD